MPQNCPDHPEIVMSGVRITEGPQWLYTLKREATAIGTYGLVGTAGLYLEKKVTSFCTVSETVILASYGILRHLVWYTGTDVSEKPVLLHFHHTFWVYCILKLERFFLDRRYLGTNLRITYQRTVIHIVPVEPRMSYEFSFCFVFD